MTAPSNDSDDAVRDAAPEGAPGVANGRRRTVRQGRTKGVDRSELITLGVLVVVLVVLSIVASLQGRGAGGSGSGDGSGNGGAADAGGGEGGPTTVVRIKGGDDIVGLPPKPGDAADDPAAKEGGSVDLGEVEVIEEELEHLALEEYDVVLPGGLILARPGADLVPNPPASIGGLVVHDRTGRLYYATDDGNWSTIWYVEDGAKHTLWTGRTDENRIELAAVAGDELWLLLTTDPPFKSRREAWQRAEQFQGVSLAKPAMSLFEVRVSKELAATVLKFCRKAN